ncbi:uncharacterized protein LOC143882116 [Tasmannia lanceolata]|uniref:uncharacterized protein LOC143882116 n=1 Tax=Tasmannia lanceolata TaxID=3420 RepID=UPI0040645B38
MVQRKAVSKLGIKTESTKDQVKSDKWSMTLKPSSQHQDIKNKGGNELKKKMKKARSFKALDLENEENQHLKFNSPSFDGSPNYMKPTSSWDARKESLKVTSHSHSQATSSSNSNVKAKSQNPRNSNSKNSDPSSLKPMKKILRRTSSLKLVRPSMKKTSSGVASYPNPNVNRATCSSTLKDSKFPEYVALHPGATESQGTSIVKVCPYTYCSLNGHHHEPLPPLKRFLSAKRRFLRMQKSMMMKGLSSPRIKSTSGRRKGIDTGQMDTIVDPIVLEEDFEGSSISPVIAEQGIDFFVEIYARSREESKEPVNQNDRRRTHDEDDGSTSEISQIPDGFDEISLLGDDDPHSEISSEDDPDQNIEILSEEMDLLMSSLECDYDVQFEIPDKENSPKLIQADLEETGFNCCIERDSGKESELDESTISKASDMDWEEQVASYPDNGNDFPTLSSDGSDPLTVTLPGNEDVGFHDGLLFKRDDSVSTCEEDTRDFTRSGTYEGDGTNLDGDQTSGVVDILEIEETDNVNCMDVIEFLTLSASTDSIEKQTEVGEEENGNPELDNVSLQVNPLLGVVDEQEDSLQDDSEMDNHFVTEDQSSETDEEAVTSDVLGGGVLKGETTESTDSETDQEAVTSDVFVGSILEGKTAESIDSETDDEAFTSDDKPDHASGADDEDGMERTEQVEDVSSFLQIDISSSHQGYSGADQDILKEDQSLVQPMESEEDQSLVQQTKSEGCHCEKKNCIQETLIDPNSSVLDQGVHPEDGAERTEQVEDSSGLHEIGISGYSEAGQDIANEDHSLLQTMEAEDRHCDEKKCSQEALVDLNITILDEIVPPASQNYSSDDQSDICEIVNIQEHLEKDQRELGGCKDCIDTEKTESNSSEGSEGGDDKMKIEYETDSDASNIKISEEDKLIISAGTESDMTCCDLKRIANRKGMKTIEDCEEDREFNPRAPRYLIPEPDPEAEKVDLRHQMMDERKGAEEWMLDYALQQAVSKLAPARKKRVSLLVEAFETVTPVPKYETHLQDATANFPHARPIQACS